ncbi:MAG: hypothetical protein CBC38_04250 [Gammaproteobacteria bacterium TMED78]|nr:MAG: hypothetical protein CBC38_04250 [Gammaproteobacteria bacterium TMED78]|tara:strand:+ start:97300 stop:98151 length:852 start_codon:yes stop_codon:yes gene_type:complete
MYRSLLFIPGNKENMLLKAASFSPDAFVPDMEDSVPDKEKSNARDLISDFIPKLAQKKIPIIPRVNSLNTEFVKYDIEAIIGPHITAISIGKIRKPQDIEKLEQILSKLEIKNKLAIGNIKIIPWLENAEAIVNSYDICSCSKRISGVAFGAEDFTHDMGINRLEDNSEIQYAKNIISISAKAAKIIALDTPFFKFKDNKKLKIDCQKSKEIGFRGKFAIHPNQIKTINKAFLPSKKEILEAREIVATYEKAEKKGRGSTSLKDQVIDIPVVKRAKDLLNLIK